MIYLDNNATTPLDPRVLEAMMPFLTDQFGNASSSHAFGVKISKKVKQAREQVARLIGATGHEIVFTSGATEAINMAIKGVADAYRSGGKHIVTVSTEHHAVLDTCKYLEERGYEVTYLPVHSDGLLDLATVKSTIREDTVLVSVMLVNNETGVIQHIKEIAEYAHENGALFLTDATQAVGKMAVDVEELGIDLMAFSGHKFYGPKGIGALYVRGQAANKVKIHPLLHGGGHEKGYRSGTLNVPGIVGLAKAAEIALQEMITDAERIGKLRDELESKLLALDNAFLNGHKNLRLYNTSNICFRGIDADAVILGLKDIMISNGSACTSAIIEPSHVLTAMGLSNEDAFSSLRFSVGKSNSSPEVAVGISKITEMVSYRVA